jgi:Cu(I)/Ag(I) efflux system periplasmic protein CusF
MNRIISTLLIALSASLPALAQQKADEHSAHHPAPGASASAATATAADMADGEVRKIDKAQSKITLKHAEIKSLDMPPMTMVFSVKDKALLERVQPGDKVKFKAVNEAGKYTVTDLQVVR